MASNDNEISNTISTKEEKLHEGYHGWMKSIPKTQQDFTPVRITTNSIEDKDSRLTNGSSAWNSAGTWEEKDKSTWARERLEHHIMTSFTFQDESRNVSIIATSMLKCDGDAKVIYSRGKKRCGYDLKVKFNWKSTRITKDGNDDDTDENDVQGHVEIHDFDDMNGEDFEVRIKTNGESTAHSRDAFQAILDWEKEFRKILMEWKKDLLEQ